MGDNYDSFRALVFIVPTVHADRVADELWSALDYENIPMHGIVCDVEQLGAKPYAPEWLANSLTRTVASNFYAQSGNEFPEDWYGDDDE